MTFAEVCRRASGRRAYNRRRRLERARRVSRLIALLAADPTLPGRLLAAAFEVHESTISRDLKFIAGVKAEYRELTGAELRPSSFRWGRGALGYELVFELRGGVRVR